MRPVLKSALLILFLVILFSVESRAGDFPVSIKDAGGQTLTLDQKPSRIISLMPNITEMLFALGAGDRLVGVSERSDHPLAAARLPVVGGQVLNIEKIAGLKPDLIIGLPLCQSDSLEKLRSLSLKVFIIDPGSLNKLVSTMKMLGRITGTETNALKAAGVLSSRIEDVRKKPPVYRPSAALLVWTDPLIAAGRNTFLDDLIDSAGGRNLFSRTKTSYPEISREYLLSSDPDVLILPSEIKKSFLALVKKDTLFSRLKAVKRGHVLVIDGDIISRPGPRLVLALEQIHQYFLKINRD
jgi:iron complex transport system substrate-binding protein